MFDYDFDYRKENGTIRFWAIPLMSNLNSSMSLDVAITLMTSSYVERGLDLKFVGQVTPHFVADLYKHVTWPKQLKWYNTTSAQRRNIIKGWKQWKEHQDS